MGHITQGQLDFDPPRARKTDPPTSRKAASRIKVGGIRHKILNCMEEFRGGCATFQIAAALGIARDSVSPHMKPLKAMRLVVEGAPDIVNPATNNDCMRWRLTNDYWLSNIPKKVGRVGAYSKRCPTCGRDL